MRVFSLPCVSTLRLLVASCTVAIISLLATSCASGGGTENYCVSLYAPEYAVGFEILGADDRESAVIVTKAPWQGADSLAATSLFVRRGDESLPANFSGQVLDGEAKRIVCMSASHIAMLDALGAVDRVVGVSGINLVCNAKVQARRDSIADVGYNSNVDYERLIAVGADLILLYGVSGASGMEGKLRELGIPFMYVGEYLEESPLGRAEWLVALAEVVGKREEGRAVFDAIPQRYDHLKAIAATATERPRVMINTPYGDSWVMASTDSYVARLIRDAGGDYIYKENTSRQSLPVSMEQAYQLTSSADVWLNVGQTTSLAELLRLLPKFAGTRPVATSQVWNTILRATPSGANEYWESAAIHPDLVLQDLILIFHPDLISESLTYYKNLQ
ncbi:MAG: ABC transporter substrate-binding protein [Bacteroidaceae bacterium]|nr:ABC transporter substrate-binding protein [Bacteroidaceae bacterium]